MNHDATHCIACDDRCPKECYRAQLTRELMRMLSCYPLSVSWSNFEGTEECKRKDAQKGRSNG